MREKRGMTQNKTNVEKKVEQPKIILTIAGSDILSGGGIQADLATFTEYGLFGLSVITSIVTVKADTFTITLIDLDLVAAQLASIEENYQLSAIKIGLVPSVEMIKLVGTFVQRVGQNIPVVVDPVMVFKENGSVPIQELVDAFKSDLLPFATVTTPNLTETKMLAGGIEIANEVDLQVAAQNILDSGAKAVVAKGGTRLNKKTAIDVLVAKDVVKVFQAPIVNAKFNNGAGCTFSSAIASQLALGQEIETAVQNAKDFVFQGIKHGVAISPEFGNVWQGANRL
ncbi:MAG: bifunctional hydroxymethylpyrimidine kinase/phosphomethylpyrimidine kinase [Lactobacillaceae bacterium]|jgi:pyridoxine kinase|nr:bifunctional hydroxymethylpyrimidine kinase/phosphomethylpyrimidine kinase [Lactobacillaceae bacterium]